ncbi:MAG TPA: sodium ion-translocating decarboxylase subunit beta [Syntrophorhabdaceae bacterium]|jgi:oxaloacetate decarboxylase beta subunit|nr:sodium ion-translocating decarboxylase subunit beta [Syntrophorhabdaceae bacterium]HOS05553.1 sodium ion-translocating decarboxylase subunit beta [Syntrophorhabdaceae bacterium]HPH40946.1 sodium ion-translocating decarboxylase subunit beta [Syntrophorhabdaceae bacterium]HPL40702.1 sodium ion-translocating decarboxylase subunit beta [Syntrophorhabdaceae bacterium]
MVDAILGGLTGLIAGVSALHWSNLVMIAIGAILIYLGVKKDFEPLLLVPIGFGCILVNIPLAGLMEDEGFLRTIYNMGIQNELFPLLIFVGIGAMTDFRPVLENPYTFLLGAAGQFGIFLTLIISLALGFPYNEAVTIGIIGACDGPTVIYVASKYAKELLGPCSVAAYSYMSLVPLLQPPIMKMLTTRKERETVMKTHKKTVSDTTALLFPIVITIIGGLIAPMGLPLLATIMLGNFMKESGAVARLTKVSENEIANAVTLFLGLAIGGTMNGEVFVKPQTILILCLGLLAICLDTVFGVLFGKVLYYVTGGKVNPLIGAAGISAFPMSARVVQKEGQKYNKKNYLLMHAMGANAGGQVGSVMAAAVMLSVLKAMGVI